MKAIKVGLLTASLLFMTACGGSNNGKVKELRMAHNLSETHSVHLAIVNFGQELEKISNGTMKVIVFPNGVLGSEGGTLEQLQKGIIDMTKVSAGALENFDKSYAVFNLPYVFQDEKHFYNVMDSDIAQKIYGATKNKGFMGITYYDSGARSFYTVNKPINTPEDLKGLKIRVMENQSAIKMIQLLGGAPTPMPYGEIYTALQQKVVDGAESNETVLNVGRHGEVAKAFSLDEHTRIPDIALISSRTWDKLNDQQREWVKQAAKASTEYHKGLWHESIENAVHEAKTKMNVTFYTPDKEPFRKAVQPMIDEFKQNPENAAIIDKIDALRK